MIQSKNNIKSSSFLLFTNIIQNCFVVALILIFIIQHNLGTYYNSSNFIYLNSLNYLQTCKKLNYSDYKYKFMNSSLLIINAFLWLGFIFKIIIFFGAIVFFKKYVIRQKKYEIYQTHRIKRTLYVLEILVLYFYGLAFGYIAKFYLEIFSMSCINNQIREYQSACLKYLIIASLNFIFSLCSIFFCFLIETEVVLNSNGDKKEIQKQLNKIQDKRNLNNQLDTQRGLMVNVQNQYKRAKANTDNKINIQKNSTVKSQIDKLSKQNSKADVLNFLAENQQKLKNTQQKSQKQVKSKQSSALKNEEQQQKVYQRNKIHKQIIKTKDQQQQQKIEIDEDDEQEIKQDKKIQQNKNTLLYSLNIQSERRNKNKQKVPIESKLQQKIHNYEPQLFLQSSIKQNTHSRQQSNQIIVKKQQVDPIFSNPYKRSDSQKKSMSKRSQKGPPIRLMKQLSQKSDDTFTRSKIAGSQGIQTIHLQRNGKKI